MDYRKTAFLSIISNEIKLTSLCYLRKTVFFPHGGALQVSILVTDIHN
jgi:hypothetical protein